MQPCRFVLPVLLLWSGLAAAQGLMVPEDRSLTPLAVVKHQVRIAIDDQVAVTKVEQIFRNPTDRPLEATYLFPVPKGASVNEFAMWVNGEKQTGEILKADDARKTYTDIVRRTQDPGLLEYVSNSLMRLRVFPIPAHGEQKVTLSYTSVASQENGAVGYVYPLKGEGKVASEGFSLKATIKSANGVQSVYSPSHAVTVKHVNDHEATLTCEPKDARTDKDFQLFYSLGDKDVGLTALTYRPVSTEDGHFLMLLSPKIDMQKTTAVPRDVVLVLDTSGSMQGVKINQAKKALDHCLKNLNAEDRFAVINFCSTVNKYRDHLVPSSEEQIENARKWVGRLEATSGTAINDALQAALEMREDKPGRSFTVVFFTDGMPTEGECNPEKIVQNVMAKNTADTRIFTFGVGDDVNATLLDQIADQTRAVSTFVRPNEDIEAKTSALYDKISHPVLTNLKLKVGGDDVQLSEVYPPHLPDLFHGGQIVVAGRYEGHGAARVTLTGMFGTEKKEFVFETKFEKKTGEEKAFVEQLWARRKVGYLLDQIRANGEKKELVDEVTAIAKKHGIATPYTSYLVAPDAGRMASNVSAPPVNATNITTIVNTNTTTGVVTNVVNNGNVTNTPIAPPMSAGAGYPHPTAGRTVPPSTPAHPSVPLPQGNYLQRAPQYAPSAPAAATAAAPQPDLHLENISEAPKGGREVHPGTRYAPAFKNNQPQARVMAEAGAALRNGDRDGYQSGRVGVELSLQLKELRETNRLDAAAMKRVGGRSLRDLGGAWVDDGFAEKMTLVEVKAMSAAYFRILEQHPEMAEVFRLGNRVVWVTPSGAALVIDDGHGKEELGDKEIDELFVAKK